MDEFYIRSRSNLLKRLKLIKPIINRTEPMIEIGCGLGYVVNLISSNLDINVIGLDISETAIEKAKSLFPNNQFIVHDISKEKKSFATPSVVILSNILWYILEDIETISKNIINLFHPSNSYPMVIIQNAFFKGNQRYGKSICDGFEGAIKLFHLNFKKLGLEIEQIESFLDENDKMKYDDGIIIFSLKKIDR
jgi:hypothetical protein